MNSYFKTPAAITSLFQQAIDVLHQYGYDVAGKLMEEALRHDPYNLAAHYELAIYHASVKNTGRFRHHLFICWNLDPSCANRLLNHPTVLDGISTSELEEMTVLKEKERYPIKEFTAIDPVGHTAHLRFKPDHKNEIAAFYKAFRYKEDNCFIMDKPAQGSLTGLDQEVDFSKVDYFKLLYTKNSRVTDQPTEVVYAALQQISPHMQDVRFLIQSEWAEGYLDEVIIQQGQFHIYRHLLADDSWNGRLLYLESIVQANPNDEVLRAWLVDEYVGQTMIELHELQWNKDTSEPPSLRKVLPLAGNDHPWVDFINGKMHLKKGEVKTALHFYRKAVSKSPGIFDFHYALGELLTTASTQYEESINNLSKALEIKKLPDIYIHRALMYCKVGKVAAADADIALYIDFIQPYYHGNLVNAGHWFVDDRFLTQANTLYRAALQKNEQYEDQLTQKNVEDTRYRNEQIYEAQLLINANSRLIIYIGLQITSSNEEQAQAYAKKALELINTDADTLYSAGFVLHSGGKKTEEAELYYNRALAKDPHFINALNQKSLIRLAQKDYEQAWQLADQLLSLDAYFAEALITKANVCFYRGELSAALKFYEEYTILKPDSATGYSGMGFIMCHLWRDADAIPLLQKAISLATEQDMDVSAWWSNLANCYCNMGEYEKAIAAAECSIAIMPEYYHPYYSLACIYAKQNQKEKALEMVQQVLNYNPDKRDALLNEADLAAIRVDLVNLL